MNVKYYFILGSTFTGSQHIICEDHLNQRKKMMRKDGWVEEGLTKLPEHFVCEDCNPSIKWEQRKSLNIL